MTWIRFDPFELAAPSLATAANPGAIDLRGRVSQVVFFGHGPDCKACAALARQLTSEGAAWAESTAKIVLVSPLPFWPDGVGDSHALADPDGRLRDRYARLLEFDTTGCLFLFVLDQHGAPFAAWVGQEPDGSDLVGEASTWLAFAERQCPE